MGQSGLDRRVVLPLRSFMISQDKEFFDGGYTSPGHRFIPATMLPLTSNRRTRHIPVERPGLNHGFSTTETDGQRMLHLVPPPVRRLPESVRRGPARWVAARFHRVPKKFGDSASCSRALLNVGVTSGNRKRRTRSVCRWPPSLVDRPCLSSWQLTAARPKVWRR